jgi:hypothetical protein
MTQQNSHSKRRSRQNEKRRRLTPHRQRCEDAYHSRKIASLAGNSRRERERERDGGLMNINLLQKNHDL